MYSCLRALSLSGAARAACPSSPAPVPAGAPHAATVPIVLQGGPGHASSDLAEFYAGRSLGDACVHGIKRPPFALAGNRRASH